MKLPRGEVRRILVPVDASRHAERALEMAVTIGRASRARVYLLHACEVHVGLFDAQRLPELGGRDCPVHLESEQLLGEMAARVARAGLETDSHLMHKPPLDAILAAARRLEIDLIVMGTRGLHSPDQVRVGSVAERTMRLASCPVLIVRGAVQAAELKREARGC